MPVSRKYVRNCFQMNRCNCRDGLHFYNDFAIDDDVRTESYVEFYVFVNYRHTLLGKRG